MRLILDTNIFVAAGFSPRSSSAKIIKAVRAGEYQLIWNQATKRETKAIISKIPPLSWERFSQLFKPKNEFTNKTYPQEFKQIKDPDDRKFAALASATKATIITNDDHLLTHKNTLHVKILTPGELIPSFA